MTFLSSEDLKLQLTSPGGVISHDSYTISKGGDLLVGAYQYSFRLYDNDSKAYTKWSTLSAPIHIFKSKPSTNISDQDRNTAVVGEQSDLKVEFNIDILLSRLKRNTHIQFAVVEHLGNLGAANPTTAGVMSLEELDYPTIKTPSEDGLRTISYIHKSNKVENRVDINELIIPFSAIEKVGTLNIKDNRLIAGNITYRDYNNDVNPTLESGAKILKREDNYVDPEVASKYKGYFNDLYRYAISYFDADFNLTQPKVLDLSSLADNDSDTIDFKFKKSDRVDILGKAEQIGLRLELSDHPSWAKGFIILRAKRIKDVLFETPLIPFIKIDGVTPTADYPGTFSFDYGQGGVDKELIGAQPMNPVGTFTPENSLTRSYSENNENEDGYRMFIGRQQISKAGSAKGESIPVFKQNPTKFGMLIPQMYNSDGEFVEAFNYTGSEIIEVDELLNCRPILTKDAGTTESLGVNKDTNASVTYNAAAYTTVNKVTAKIKGFTQLTNRGEGTVLNGQPVGQYDALLTDGTGWTELPSNNRMGVIESSEPLRTFIQSSRNRSGVVKNNTGFTSLDLFGEDPIDLLDSSRVCYYPLATIRKGLSDDRYGDESTQHEFIYTGTSVLFDDSHIASDSYTVDIWGGDCYNTAHDFAFGTSSFIVPSLGKSINAEANEETLEEATDRYGGGFLVLNKDLAETTLRQKVMSLPVPYKQLSQSVTSLLRSEVNGSIVDNRGGTYSYLSGTFTNDKRNKQRTLGGRILTRLDIDKAPFFDYLISPAAVKEGDAQVFFTRPELLDENLELKSRLIYSDLKIYQTSDDSFRKFRVSNFFDLDEVNGNLISLSRIHDSIFGIQERGIVHIPVNENEISSADGTILSIRSGDIIGNVKTINNRYGARNINNVYNANNFIIVSDNRNNAVIELTPEIRYLSDKGFRTIVEKGIDDNASFCYDYNERKLYYKINSSDVYVYNYLLDAWETRLPTTGVNNLAGDNIENQFYLTDNNKLYKTESESFGGGSTLSFLGEDYTPSIRFTVNPEVEIGKVLDNIIIESSEDIENINYKIDDIDSTQDIPSKYREGYFIKALRRGSNNQRLRGRYAEVTLTLPASDFKLTSVLHKYRPSSRIL